jgi:PAS domain S-box-containing protein
MRRVTRDGDMRAVNVSDVTSPNTIDATLVLHTLGVATPDLIYAIDRSGRYTFVSDAGARALGLTATEMIGRTWAEVGLPAEREREFVLERESILATGKSVRREVTFPLRDGERTFDFVISPLIDADARPIGTIVVSRDITARTLAETRLRDELRFRGAIERSLLTGLTTIDTSGRITYASPAFARMVGWSEEEIRAMSAPYPFWAVEERDRLLSLFEAAKQGDLEPVSGELMFQRRDGERFPVAIQRSPLLAEDGSAIGWLAVVNDATMQRRMAQQVAQSEQQYRDLADSMPQIVWAARPDGRVDYFNRRWYEYTGAPAGLSGDESWQDLLHPDDRERTRAQWYAAVASGDVFEIEYRFRKASTGTYCWHLGRALPIRDADGRIARWYGTCTDIEELKRAQRDLSGREEILQRQNLMLQTLLDVSEVMSAELDVEKLVQFVTDAATRLVGAQFGAFFYNVVDASGEAYMLFTISGVPREEFAKFPMPRNTAIFAPTFSGSGIVRSDDIRKDPRYGQNAPYHGMPAGHLPVVSYLAVPVISKRGHVIGGLFFGHGEPGKFTEDAERLVAGVAAQAAISIDNARLIVDATRSAERVRREEERYRTLVTATSQIVWSASPAGGVEVDLPTWREVTGQTFDQLKGYGWLDVVHPADRDRVYAEWQEALRESKPFITEYRIRTRDGSYRWFAVRGYAMHDERGVVREWIGTATDVDDRKRAAEAASFIADASVLLTSSLDPETILTRLAELAVPRLADACVVDVRGDGGEYRRLAIATADADTRNAIAKLDPAHRGDGNDDPVVNVLTTGKPRWFEVLAAESGASAEPWQRLVQSLRLTSAVIVPIVVGGRPFGALTLGHAESGRRFSERDLLLAEDVAGRAGVAVYNARLYMEAQAANRAKDEFLATLSHELRTPMTSILGWARMLKMGALEADLVEEAISAIEKSSRAQAQLIDDILDVSRITLGKLRLAIDHVDVNEIVSGAIDAVRAAANAKGVALNVVPERGALIVKGDPNRLQQVVWNLVNNAVKFTPGGGEVRVVTSLEDAAILVRVIDSGEGIAPEFLPYIFDRFRQADSTTTRRFGGLGLGLAIVKQIAELHGGTVTVESEGPGRGATFTVSIPAENAPAGEDEFPAAIAPHALLADLRELDVLVVDDEPQSRRFFSAALSQAGASVRAVSSADEALGSIRRKIPALIISDIAMPERDGFSLIADIRNILRLDERRLPAIAVTAFGRNEDRVRILASGFQRYLIKPLDPVDLTRTVAELMGRVPAG